MPLEEHWALLKDATSLPAISRLTQTDGGLLHEAGAAHGQIELTG